MVKYNIIFLAFLAVSVMSGLPDSMKCAENEEEFLCLSIADNEKEVEKFFHDSSEFDSIVSGTGKRMLEAKTEVVKGDVKVEDKSVEDVKKPVDEVKEADKPVEKKTEEKSEKVEEKVEKKPETKVEGDVKKVDEDKKPKEEAKPSEEEKEVKKDTNEAKESTKVEETEETTITEPTETKPEAKETEKETKKIYSYPIYKNKVGRVCVNKKADLKTKRQACSKTFTSCLSDSKDMKTCPNFGGKVNFSSPQKGEKVEKPINTEETAKKDTPKKKSLKSNHYFLFFSFLLCAIIFGTTMSLSKYYKSEFLKNKQAPFKPPSWAPQSLFPADPFYYEHELVRPMVDEYLR